MNKKKIAIVLGIVAVIAGGTLIAVSSSSGKQRTELAVAMQEDIEEDIETVEDDTDVSSGESLGDIIAGEETEVKEVENDINAILNPDLDPDLHVTFDGDIQIDDTLLSAIQNTEAYVSAEDAGKWYIPLKDYWEEDFTTNLNTMLKSYHDGVIDKNEYFMWLLEDTWPVELKDQDAFNIRLGVITSAEIAEMQAQAEKNRGVTDTEGSGSSSSTNKPSSSKPSSSGGSSANGGGANGGGANGGYDVVNWEPDPAEVSSGGGSGQVTLPPDVPIGTWDDIANMTHEDVPFTGIY